MLSHLRVSCKKYLDRFGKLNKSQSKLSFDTKREGQVGEGYVGNLGIVKYNVRKIKLAMANMIIVNELPFRFVEGEGFQDFMKTVESKFSIFPHYTMMKDYFKLFISENQKFEGNVHDNQCLGLS